MLADISSGNVDAADVFFLLAVILAALAAVLYAVGNRPVNTVEAGHHIRVAVWAPALGWLAVAFAALGWLVL